MAYIGRDIDKISNVEVLDNITFDGSSSYTLQKGGSNFTPSSANTLLVSIDGVVQAGNFTVSGSTINFGTAVAGTSTCNFILHYGVGLITAPADGTVTTAKLADSSVTTAKLNDASVSLAKLTATGTKDATTFLRGDNTFSVPAGGANTPAFEAKLSGSQTVSNGANTKIQLANEIFDTDNCFDNTTNYRFTPNVAGKYFVYVKANAESSNQEMTRLNVYIFKNGSYSEYTDIMSRDSNYFRIASGFYSKIVEMNGTTDYLEAYCYVTGGGTLGLLTNNSHFGAYKIIE